jgi:hypothetical protein
MLSLRQSGTLHFSRVQFFRAARGKTAHKMINKYHAAAGEKRTFEMQNSVTPKGFK